MSIVALLGPLRSHGTMDRIEAMCVCDVQMQDNVSCLIICGYFFTSLVPSRRRDDRSKDQTLPAIAVCIVAPFLSYNLRLVS